MILAMGKALGSLPATLVLGLAGRAVERFQCYRRAWRERTQLLGLNERELRDIGISRVDAWREAERPLWAGCGSGNVRIGRPQP